MILYNKLFELLEEKGLNKAYLRNNGINPKTVDKLIKNTEVTTTSLNKICNILECDIFDILEYKKDEIDNNSLR